MIKGHTQESESRLSSNSKKRLIQTKMVWESVMEKEAAFWVWLWKGESEMKGRKGCPQHRKHGFADGLGEGGAWGAGGDMKRERSLEQGDTWLSGGRGWRTIYFITRSGREDGLSRKEFLYYSFHLLYDMIKIRKIIKSKTITFNPIPQTPAVLICFQSNSFLCAHIY